MKKILDLLARAADARQALEQARIDYEKAKGLCALEQEIVEAELKKEREKDNANT